MISGVVTDHDSSKTCVIMCIVLCKELFSIPWLFMYICFKNS